MILKSYINLFQFSYASHNPASLQYYKINVSSDITHFKHIFWNSAMLTIIQ